MCCKIPEQAKLQTCRELPEHVGFCFKERATNPQYEGLHFASKGGRKYKTFEACLFLRRPDQTTIEKFYTYVGLKGRYNGSGQTNSVARSAAGSEPSEERPVRISKPALTPHQLWVERCGKCQNCTKPDCSKCICCRGNKKDPTARNCCYQKVRKESVLTPGSSCLVQ